MVKTKIIFTIGPATGNRDVLAQILTNGADCVRFNFSHLSHEVLAKYLGLVHQAELLVGRKVETLGDTKGPEVRLGVMQGGCAELYAGDKFTLTTKKVVGDKKCVTVDYSRLPDIMNIGDKIMLADGVPELQVTEIRDGQVETKVTRGGVIADYKRVACPGKALDLPFLSSRDREDIIFAAEHGFDYIAASFVQKADDVRAIRNLLQISDNHEVKVIAKMENFASICNMGEIIKEADGAMVARGDLGIEIPIEQVPLVQKRIIRECTKDSKISVTATQMLESMCNFVRPTRAEVTDVANAVFDGSDYVMLSGETASGKYPVDAVRMMEKIIEATELSEEYRFSYYDRYIHRQ